MKSTRRSQEEKVKREQMQELLTSLGTSSLRELRELFGQIVGTFLEGCMDAELYEELGYNWYERKPQAVQNSRNGYLRKKLRTSYGTVVINTPRDRKGEFEPKLIRKNQRSIDPEVEATILSMYGKGLTRRDLRANIKEIYKKDISDSLVSVITDQVLTQAREWQNRLLEQIYAFVFIDAVHFTVKSKRQMVKKTVYVAIGCDMDGRKEVLGLWIGEHESVKYWLTVLNELKSRGVEDILIACMDNLTGLTEAFEAVFPKTVIQKYIVQPIQSRFKSAPYRDRRRLPPI